MLAPWRRRCGGRDSESRVFLPNTEASRLGSGAVAQAESLCYAKRGFGGTDQTFGPQIRSISMNFQGLAVSYAESSGINLRQRARTR
jgi:hypothetical protein